ncbi:hypothetical protein Pint_30605 [Pistacia integerrima]|uniref:Uncharacterized protein n=1 Tax=Pistacia integerrima TaxID=434235 RepID=A0ACC0X345_9ROSI|nr:hypothetical protein Pint_30605 [Pistacia integerrima]
MGLGGWLTPCIGYGVMGGVFPASCCQGIRALNAASNTTEDRRAQCNCDKEGAAKIPGLDYDRVNTLPGICGSNCPYKLTHDLDCSNPQIPSPQTPPNTLPGICGSNCPYKLTDDLDCSK